MNIRLQQFLTAENISQAQFADTIGVARASVSHILAGRNKPGFDFIESMARHYPEINLEWLISGKGKMYKAGDKQVVESTLFNDVRQEEPVKEELKTENILPPPADPKPQPKIEPEFKPKQRTVAKIVIFYDDNTYQELK